VQNGTTERNDSVQGDTMGKAKIVYLDEYRKSRHYKNVFELIEGHLAEAVVSGKYLSASCRASQLSRESWFRSDQDSSGICRK